MTEENQGRHLNFGVMNESISDEDWAALSHDLKGLVTRHAGKGLDLHLVHLDLMQMIITWLVYNGMPDHKLRPIIDTLVSAAEVDLKDQAEAIPVTLQ